MHRVNIFLEHTRSDWIERAFDDLSSLCWHSSGRWQNKVGEKEKSVNGDDKNKSCVTERSKVDSTVKDGILRLVALFGRNLQNQSTNPRCQQLHAAARARWVNKAKRE